MQRDVEFPHPDLLHLRPLQKIAQKATEFEATIELRKESTTVNAKSLLELMEFANYLVSFPGNSVVTITAFGTDAPQALVALVETIEQSIAVTT